MTKDIVCYIMNKLHSIYIVVFKVTEKSEKNKTSSKDKGEVNIRQII